MLAACCFVPCCRIRLLPGRCQILMEQVVGVVLCVGASLVVVCNYRVISKGWGWLLAYAALTGMVLGVP